MKKIFLLIACIVSVHAYAQSYAEDILRWQQHYKAEFLTDPRSPVKAADTAYISFFPPDKKYAVHAAVMLTPDAPAFDMATHAGTTKRYRPYATLHFYNPANRSCTLTVYERVNPPAGDTASGSALFLPFQDMTNGGATYGGRRYIDLLKAEIKARKLLLDFNKAYNPYCAFGGGFSCPIPPDENRLKMYVRAGEKLPLPPLGPKE